MADLVKTIYALQSGHSVSAALQPWFRHDLSAIGAHRVQINIDDAAVAQAQLRTVNEPAPIRTVISIWSDPDTEAVTQIVRNLDSSASGWQVEERTPMAPPRTPDGQRADTLANMAFLRKPDELSQEEWLERWIGQHTYLAIEIQATFGYIQNIVEECLTDTTPPVAGIVEELFPMSAMTDWHAFYGSDGSQAKLERRMKLMSQSCDRFGATRGINVVPSSRYVFELS